MREWCRARGSFLLDAQKVVAKWILRFERGVGASFIGKYAIFGGICAENYANSAKKLLSPAGLTIIIGSLAIKIKSCQSKSLSKRGAQNGFDGISEQCRVDDELICVAALFHERRLGNRCFCFSAEKRTGFVAGFPFCEKVQMGWPVGGD